MKSQMQIAFPFVSSVNYFLQFLQKSRSGVILRLATKRRDTMTYREDFTLPVGILERVNKQGFDILPELIHVILNAAVQGERQQYLKAESYRWIALSRGKFLLTVRRRI
jgi:hypothetical protein